MRTLILLVLTTMLTTGTLAVNGKIINIKDCGAKPEPGFDNYHAINQAVRKLEDGDSLIMPKGVYEVYSRNLPASERIFSIIGKKNITIDGCDSTILLCDMERANTFYFENCLNPTLKNVIVDLKKAPFTQGRVISTDADSLTIEIDRGNFLPNMKNILTMYDYDAATRRIIGNFDLYKTGIEKIEKIDDHHVKLTCKKLTDLRKQEIFPFCIKNAPSSLVCLKSSTSYRDYHADYLRCENVLIENVRLYAGAQMGIHAGSATKNITVKNVKIIRKPGSDRLMSVNFDALHFSYVKGKIEIIDCDFAASGDDGININCGKYLGIAGIHPGDNSVDTFKATIGYQGERPLRGDVMRIIDKDTYEPVGKLTVKRADWNAAKKGFTIIFKEDVKILSKQHLLFNTAFIPESVHISGCTFESMRGRGVVLSVGNLTVEKCKFLYMSFPALMVIGMTRRQAFSGDNIIIKDNYFKGMAGGAIYINAHNMYNNDKLKPGAFNHVKVIDNTIEEDESLYPRRFKSVAAKYPYWSSAMYFSGVNDLTVTGNKISGFKCVGFLTADKNVKFARNKSDKNTFLLLNRATVSGLDTDVKIRDFNDRDFDKSEYYIQNFN